MKWVLIVWTLWQPNVPVKAVEIEFATEQQCQEALEVVLDRYKQVKSRNFGYTLQCREKE